MRKKVDPDRQARQLAALLVVVLGALAGLAAWRGHSGRAWITGALAAAAGLVPLVSWPAWTAFYRAWMRLAHVLSIVTTTVILTLCFAVVFVPVGVAMRLAGRDALGLRWSRRKPSYWIDKGEATYTLDRYERQY